MRGMLRSHIVFLIAAIFSACSFPAAAASEPTKTVGNAPTKAEYDRSGTADSTPKSQQSTPNTLSATAEINKPIGDHTKKESKEVQGSAESESGDGWGVAVWTAVFSAVGAMLSALVTIALAALGFFSWKTSKAAVDIAKDSLHASKELAAKQSRAYVFITTIAMQYAALYDQESNAVSVTLKNYGQTPAQLTSFCITIIEGTDRRETPAEAQLMRSILGPGEAVSV